MSEIDLIKYIKSNLNSDQAGFFSCVMLHQKMEDLAWYGALRIGEIVKECYNNKISNILLCLKLENSIQKLNEMGENDILLLSIHNPNFKSISSHIVSEFLTQRKSIVFIGTSDDSESKNIIDITMIGIEVVGLNKKLQCIIEIYKKGKREIELSMPDKALVTKYRQIKKELLIETIKRPKMDLI